MIQIAICDDEQNSRAYLKQLVLKQRVLDENAQDYEIVEFSSGTELLNASKEFDILFLDIDLKEERTGMEVARILRNHSKEKQPIIIFISGLTQTIFAKYMGVSVKQLKHGNQDVIIPMVQLAGCWHLLGIIPIFPSLRVY